MNTFLIIGIFVTAALLGHAAIVWLSARLTNLPRKGWWRALSVSVVRFVAIIGVWMFVATFSTAHEIQMQFWSMALVADVVVSAILAWVIYRGGAGRIAAAVSLQYVAGLVLWVCLGFAGESVLETLNGDLSGMWPNIRGFHTIRELPDGNHLVINGDSDLSRSLFQLSKSDGKRPAIVVETYETSREPNPIHPENTPDRVICNKTKSPARWDVLVHSSPTEPKSRSMHRVIGLPGERVQIHDRSVWINGERLMPPERLGAIWYRSDSDQEPFRQLGTDEYLVVGDSEEPSRGYPLVGPLRDGPPDPHDHVVKRDLIVGVADVIYWPPARWRLNP